MKFEAVVDFAKFTLAITAALIAFVIAEFVPPIDGEKRGLVAVQLLFSSVAFALGIFVYSFAVSAQHDQNNTDLVEKHEVWISVLGTLYAAVLIIAVGILTALVFMRIF